MLGVEVEDRQATVVSVDDRGEVRARDRVPVSGSLSTTVGAAIDKLRGREVPDGYSVLGVATPLVDSPTVRSALAELATQFSGPFVKQGAVASGTAAAVGEAWVGAARGAHDV